MTVIPLGHALLRGSSDLPGSCDAPSRHVPAPKRVLLPYLVLLRVGFALPPPLLAARCALTAPFHPYLAQPSQQAQSPTFLAGGPCWDGWARRYILCGTFRKRPL